MTDFTIARALRGRLAVRPTLRTIVDNTGWLMLDRFVRLALGLTVGAWVARYLEPARYGELMYSVAMVALFQTVANLGADGIIIRDLVKYPENAREILGTAFCLRLFSGLSSWVLALGSVTFLRPQDTNAAMITAIVGAVLVFQAFDTIDLWFQSQNQNRRTVLPKLLAYILSNGVKVVFIQIHASLIMFASALLMDVVIAAIGLGVSYRRFPITGAWRYRSPLAWDLIKQSVPFLLSGLAIMIYMRIDQIMIRQMVSDKELGIFSAGMALSSFWGFIPLTLSTVLAPYVARKKTESEEAYYKALANVFRGYAALSILIVTLVEVSGPTAVRLLYGEAYAPAVHVLSIHILTFVFVSLGIAQNLWIVNERTGSIALWKAITGVIVCLLGNYLLIPILGGIGAALVAVLVQFLSAVASNLVLAPRILKMQLMSIWQFPRSIGWLLTRRMYTG